MMIETGILIAIIVGISQIVKTLGLKTKYIPLLNLILGIVLTVFLTSHVSLQEGILQGLIIGLSASGLFDQTKILE